jgi:hypothetical protein
MKRIVVNPTNKDLNKLMSFTLNFFVDEDKCDLNIMIVRSAIIKILATEPINAQEERWLHLILTKYYKHDRKNKLVNNMLTQLKQN